MSRLLSGEALEVLDSERDQSKPWYFDRSTQALKEFAWLYKNLPF